MADFTLNTSVLAGGQFHTHAFEMMGEFREIQFSWSQSVANQDMEPHFLEFHYTIAGVSMDD